ncbi:MAG: Rpn family recombination-promoting nuclease/putative transposase [Candidatus Accumulibacter sp.]|jgi:predicted transposase/invertase (TIGR01784 family)|nr:Rpn family recombination-promoting nuclease/putative transposase [Accumulibacter sp.]
MSNDILSPCFDDVFKILFGDPHNGEILRAFLEATLPLPDDDYQEITLLNPFLPNERIGDKIGILDIKVKTAFGKMIDIEIQIANRAALHEHIVYYLAKMLTEQIGVGEHYGNIKPSIRILITDFAMIPDNGHYHNRFRLHDPETGADFADLLHFHTLELPKLPKKADGTKLWSWLEFLKTQNKEKLEMLAKTNQDVKKAVRDQYAREEFVRNEARSEGEKKALLAVARNALQNDLSVENIAALTGLTREEIQALLH